MDVSAQAGRANLLFPQYFVLFGTSMDWMMSTCIVEGHPFVLLSLLIPMLFCFRNTLINTPRNNASPAIWASLSPVKLTHNNNHRRHKEAREGREMVSVDKGRRAGTHA